MLFFFFLFPQSKFLTFCSLELLLLNPCVLSALPRSDFFLLRMLYRCLMLSLVSSPFLRTVFLSSECHSIRLNASLSLIISFSHWPNSQSLDFWRSPVTNLSTASASAVVCNQNGCPSNTTFHCGLQCCLKAGKISRIVRFRPSWECSKLQVPLRLLCEAKSLF